MATVKFILRKDKRNSRGEAPIYAQYIHNGSKTHIATGKRLDPKYWNDVQGKVKKHENTVTMNNYLAKLGSNINKVVISLQQTDLEPTPMRVKEAIAQLESNSKPEAILSRSLISLWEEYVNSRNNSLASGTTSNQSRTIKAMKGFLRLTKSELIMPENFTLKHLIKWQDHQNKDSKPNTVAKRLKHFKQFVKYYEELGGKVGISSSQIKYKETLAAKIFLSEEELGAFESAPVQGRLQEIRDLFVLQCYTGLRISDLKRLDKNINGDKILITSQKTKTPTQIPIINPIRKILNKYSNNIPKVSDQELNKGIKEIYLNIFPNQTIQVQENKKFVTVLKGEKISSKVASKTFITLSSERGMNINSIAKITGKSVRVLLKHYLSESQKVADKEFKSAWDK
jgi:integrase